MIRFENVTIKTNNTILIRDATFTINRHEKVCFYGKSGSGKTTVLTAMLGAIEPSSGTILYDGRPLATSFAQARRAAAFIGQESVLGAHSVRDALLLPFAYRANRMASPRDRDVRSVLAQLHLDDRILGEETAVISGGEKQRVAIARALLQRKTLFIVDEITSALDAQSSKAVLELFREIPATIVSASHDPAWFSVCSRFFRIERGSVHREAAPPENPGFFP